MGGSKKNRKKCRCGKKPGLKNPAKKFNDKKLFSLAKKLVDLKKLKKNLIKRH
jgi:hypothetical protein